MTALHWRRRAGRHAAGGPLFTLGWMVALAMAALAPLAIFATYAAVEAHRNSRAEAAALTVEVSRSIAGALDVMPGASRSARRRRATDSPTPGSGMGPCRKTGCRPGPRVRAAPPAATYTPIRSNCARIRATSAARPLK